MSQQRKPLRQWSVLSRLDGTILRFISSLARRFLWPRIETSCCNDTTMGLINLYIWWLIYRDQALGYAQDDILGYVDSMHRKSGIKKKLVLSISWINDRVQPKLPLIRYTRYLFKHLAPTWQPRRIVSLI